ncbi:MAG: AAA family ATPase [Phycisphaerae bacterium]
MNVSKRICIYYVPELSAGALPDFQVTAPNSRRDLVTALQSLNADGLVIDLDRPESNDVIVQALEACPALGVVGVTASKNVEDVMAAQRAGCRQILAKPIDLNDLVLALRRAMNEPVTVKSRGRIIGVIGSSGGVGASTVACHLAVEMAAATRAKVGLFDLDFDFGTAAIGLNVKPTFTCGDLAGAGAVDSTLIEKAAYETKYDVHLFARPDSIAEGHAVHDEAIRQMLGTASKMYGNLVIDLPHRLDPLTGAAIELCDHLLIVIQLTVPSICNARRLLDVLTTEGVAPERLDYVINRYRKNMSRCTPETVAEELKKPSFGLIPSDYKAVNDASDTGEPIGAKSPVRLAIGEVAAKLLGETPRPQRSSGWFSSLRSRAN